MTLGTVSGFSFLVSVAIFWVAAEDITGSTFGRGKEMGTLLSR